jgi:hypothetical protein
MNYNEVVSLAVALFKNEPTKHTPLWVAGPPGIGKTTLSYSAAWEMGIPRERVYIFRPSLRDPTDLVGIPVPRVDMGFTEWLPPKWLHELQGNEPALLVIDEAAQGVTMMQNALSGLVLDRFLGDVHLGPEVNVMLTSNRLEDKAGANRVVTQLGNRVMYVTQHADVETWTVWAREAGIDPWFVAYLNYRKEAALFDFDANRITNATPRSWEAASKVPQTLPPVIYREALSGLVGEARAADFLAFKRYFDALPDYHDIEKDPDNAKLPEAPEIRFAVVAYLVEHTTLKAFPNFLRYVARMPVDMQTLYMTQVTRKLPAIMGQPNGAFGVWVAKNRSAFITGDAA